MWQASFLFIDKYKTQRYLYKNSYDIIILILGERRLKMKKLLIILVSILIIFSLGGVVTYNKINQSKKVELKATDEELNVSEETVQKSQEKNIENILLLGIDHDENASDAIMIVSLDKNNKKVKLTSIMRDTYVYFGEGKSNKINYAYNYGGVELTIQKLNEIFNLDIKKYAKVDFDGFMKIVDAFGGYEAEISEAQRKEINYKLGYESLKTSGKVLLTGEQTAAYARIRRLDGDFNRTERQREIMFDIFKKAKNIPLTSYPSVISELSSYVETNLSALESLELVKFMISVDNNSAEQFRVPIDGTTSDNSEGVYHLDWDREPNIKALHNFIYGE